MATYGSTTASSMSIYHRHAWEMQRQVKGSLSTCMQRQAKGKCKGEISLGEEGICAEDTLDTMSWKKTKCKSHTYFTLPLSFGLYVGTQQCMQLNHYKILNLNIADPIIMEELHQEVIYNGPSKAFSCKKKFREIGMRMQPWV